MVFFCGSNLLLDSLFDRIELCISFFFSSSVCLLEPLKMELIPLVLCLKSGKFPCTTQRLIEDSPAINSYGSDGEFWKAV